MTPSTHHQRGGHSPANHPKIRRAQAHIAIAGGSQTSVAQVPWQVALLGEILFEIEGKLFVLRELCGGVIIDATHVLTAGHCMFDPLTEAQAPAEDFLVVAGSSDLAVTELTEQAVAVAGVRVHPYYNYAAGASDADDVAVLTLAKALNLTGASARAIGVAPANSTPSEGASAQLSGFGEQNAETKELNGKLYSLGMTVGFPRRCGGEADAVLLCASAAGGSACNGDSGSGLTSGLPATVVGVVDTVEVIAGLPCRNGADNGFANVTAPEIRDFIEGDEHPPTAPRGGGMSLSAVPRVGHAATCAPGSWSGSPAYTYTFINSANGQMLQSGSSPVYELTTADVGRTIYCQLQAANAGGTGVARTVPLPPIEDTGSSGPIQPQGPLPRPAGAVELPRTEAPANTAKGGVSLVGGSALAIKQGHTVSVKLDCAGGATCTGKLVLTVKTTSKTKGKKRTHTITIGTAMFSISAGKTTIVRITLNARGRSLLKTDHGRLTAHVAIVDAAPGLV